MTKEIRDKNLKLFQDYMGICYSSSDGGTIDLPHLLMSLSTGLRKMDYSDQQDMVYFFSILAKQILSSKYNEEGIRINGGNSNVTSI